jgi:hypothetical protein
MLKCYIHDENNETEEAVAICIVCGMGLCMEHAQRADLQIWEGKYPMPVKIMPKNLPRFICKYCTESIYTLGSD